MNEILKSYIKNFSENYSITSDEFLSFSMYQICKNYNLDNEQIVDSIVEGGGDGGLDSIAILIDKKYIYSKDEYNEYKSSINENSIINIIMLQSKEISGVKADSFIKIKDTLTNILCAKITKNLKKQYNYKLVEKLELVNYVIMDSAPKTVNINFEVAYSYSGLEDKDSISVEVKNKIKEIINLINSKTFIKESNILVNIYDSKKLIDLYNKNYEKDYILKFNEMIKMSYQSPVENGFVMIIQLNEYFELITNNGEIIDDLFEGNIRDFEGATVEVNKNITTTLSSDFDADFWWLNNGVTMIVDEYNPLPGNRTKLKNPVIVNGLQTSYTIYNYFKNNDTKLKEEKRFILLKIIKTENIDISDSIISSTNSQNPVKPAQLKATDLIQKDIEQLFLANSLFYERRKNFYKNRGKDKNKIITLEKLAQYMESIYFGNSSLARNNPTSLLKNEKVYKRIFNDSTNITTYLKVSEIALKYFEIIKKTKRNKGDVFLEKYSVSSDIFKFYIMRIIALKLTENNVIKNYNKINISKMDDNLVNEAIEELIEIIEGNFDMNNIINVSKSKKLDDLINLKYSDNKELVR